MLYVINSRNRTTASASSSDFEIQALQGITGKQFRLVEVDMPNTFYNIRAGVNNSFQLVRAGTPYNLQITPGFYDINGLLSAIQSAFDLWIPGELLCTYNSETGITRIITSSATNFEINFGTYSSTTMWYELGFLPQNYTGDNEYFSTYPPRLSEPMRAYISIEALGSNVMTDRGVRATYVATIDVNSTEIVVQTEADSYEQIVELSQPQYVSNWRVRLFDGNGSLLDLNGADWQMVLQVS